MEKEVFKDIEGFDRYQISNYGRVASTAKGMLKFLKPQVDRLGYLHVRLYPSDDRFGKYKPSDNYKNRGKRPKLEKVHRLVGEAFVEKPQEDIYLEINHKDSDRKNNYYQNLEWVTRSQNIQHSYDVGNRNKLTEHLVKLNRRPCKVTYKDGSVEYYISVTHCALSTNVSAASLTTRLIKQDKGGEPIWGKLGFKIERCQELPKGESWKFIAGIEEKLLKFREKYYPKTEEFRKKRREYARKFRAKKRNNE